MANGKKTYSLSFDPHETDAVALHEVIKSSEFVTQWWHFLSSTYLIVSYSSRMDIQNEIVEKWPNQKFLIVETNPKDYGGWLPKDAWTWIEEST